MFELNFVHLQYSKELMKMKRCEHPERNSRTLRVLKYFISRPGRKRRVQMPLRNPGSFGQNDWVTHESRPENPGYQTSNYQNTK